MLKAYSNLLFLLYFVTVFVSACSGDSEQKETPSVQTDKFNPDIDLGEGIKAFSLPAPLQVSTALKLLDIPYDESLLGPKKINPAHSSKFDKCINLGISSIDLGYATMYDDPSVAMIYGEKMETLAKDLDLSTSFDLNMLKRMDNNRENKDSLYQIILEAFGNIQSYMQEHEREEEGLIIAGGAYIEGIYILTQLATDSDQHYPGMENVIFEQESYLENIIILLNNFSADDRSKELVDHLQIIKALYANIRSTDEKNISGMSRPAVTKLTTKVEEIRNQYAS